MKPWKKQKNIFHKVKFRTDININPAKHKITYEAGLFFLGSCFSENIYNKVAYFKFKSGSNPFGILYNPAAIENLISKALQGYIYSEKNIFELNERWHSFDSHSVLSNTEKETLIENLNNAAATTAAQLKTATHVFITLGTAWVYRHKATKQIVGNCHKVPQNEFQKELLSITEIRTYLKSCISQIKAVNPEVKIVFTVSPVRHLKDGFVENSRSKAHLLTSIYEFVEENASCHYFPAYEIVQDDLRDYRFYEEDLVHPNQMAIDYIWEKFSASWIDEACTAVMKKVDAVQKGLAHKPFNPNAEAHQRFLKNLKISKEELAKVHGIDFEP